MRAFNQSARRFSSDRPRLIDRYQKQWVAVHNGKVKAQSGSLKALMKQVDEKNLPRGRLMVRFIDQDHQTLVL